MYGYISTEDPELCYNTGNRYFLGESVPQDRCAAFRWYERAASKGHPAAQYNLGMMFCLGQGVEKNIASAVNWYEKAAEQGYRLALPALAELYYKSSEKNLEKAYALYEEMAETGNAAALYNLGNMYERGEWVYKSAGIAERYFRQAAAAGHIGARIRLEKMNSPANC